MTTLLEEVSTITAKGQTTIPKSVRRALGVDRGGKIAFLVGEQGVSVTRVEPEHADHAIEAFLDFLDKDLHRRPETITPLSSSLAEQLADLTHGVNVDLDAPIHGSVDLWTL